MKSEAVFITFLMLMVLSSCHMTKELRTLEHAINSTEVSKSKPDTLRFEMSNANNILFKALLNGVDTVDLYLDTGGTELVLKHTAIKEKTSLLNGKNKQYNEENYVPLEGYNSLTLGSLSWDSLTIYPTSLLPKEADGHFGWNLFEGKVLELDYEKNLMIVHSYYDQDLKDYAKMEIEYINTLFCIKGDLSIKEKSISNRYLFDSGFQRAIVMDKDLREEVDFPTNLPVIKESKLRNSEGTEFINQVVVLDQICFNDVCAENVPAQLLSTPNPARFKTHILGNELLKRFNTIMDFQNGFVYLRPNSLMQLPYADAM